MDAKKVERARLAEDVYDDQEQDRKANATRKVRRDRLDIGEKDASDDHQKKRRNKNDYDYQEEHGGTVADKAKFLKDAKKFRDGACVNCGDLRHNAKNCMERPRLSKSLAKYSSRNPRDRFDFAKVRRGGLDCGEKHAWDDHHQKKNQYYDQDQEDIPEANATAKSEAPGK